MLHSRTAGAERVKDSAGQLLLVQELNNWVGEGWLTMEIVIVDVL